MRTDSPADSAFHEGTSFRLLIAAVLIGAALATWVARGVDEVDRDRDIDRPEPDDVAIADALRIIDYLLDRFRAA